MQVRSPTDRIFARVFSPGASSAVIARLTEVRQLPPEKPIHWCCPICEEEMYIEMKHAHLSGVAHALKMSGQGVVENPISKLQDMEPAKEVELEDDKAIKPPDLQSCKEDICMDYDENDSESESESESQEGYDRDKYAGSVGDDGKEYENSDKEEHEDRNEGEDNYDASSEGVETLEVLKEYENKEGGWEAEDDYKGQGGKSGPRAGENSESSAANAQSSMNPDAAIYIPIDWPSAPPESPMTWTCNTCGETMNIFSRSDHVTSKAHTRRARPPPSTSTIPVSMLWECDICEESMNLFYQTEHLAGRQHSARLREKGLSRDLVSFSALPTELDVRLNQVEYDRLDKDTTSPSWGYEESSTSSLIVLDPFDFTRPWIQPERAIESTNFSSRPLAQIQGDIHPRETGTGTFTCRICEYEFPQDNQWVDQIIGWECPVCHSNIPPKHQAGSLSAVHQDPLPTPPQSSHDSLPMHSPPAQEAEPVPVPEPGTFRCDFCDGREYSIDDKQYHTGGPWECAVCKKTMHTGTKERHLAGRKHQQELTRQRAQSQRPAQSRHSAASTVSSSRNVGETFPCPICDDKEFGIELWDDHSGLPWECSICDKIMHLRAKGDHMASGEHKVRELLKGMTEKPVVERQPRRPRQGTGVPQAQRTSVAETAASETGTFYCEVCGKDVPTRYKGLHVSRGWECTVCEITIHAAKKETHIAGKKHIQRLEMRAMFD